jgi:hypothetical protein
MKRLRLSTSIHASARIGISRLTLDHLMKKKGISVRRKRAVNTHSGRHSRRTRETRRREGWLR